MRDETHFVDLPCFAAINFLFIRKTAVYARAVYVTIALHGKFSHKCELWLIKCDKFNFV